MIFEFTDEEFDLIIKDCNFNDDELIEIAYMIHKRYSRAKMLFELRDKNYYMSERTLDRKINKINKRIYNVLKRRYFYETSNWKIIM